jgi:branched-chain amino acid transport system substrate-binding protein
VGALRGQAVKLAALVVVVAVIAGVVGFLAGRAAAPAAPPAAEAPVTTVTVTETIVETVAEAVERAALPSEIPIGLAIAVSGGYAVDGPRRLNGALLAIEEMNRLLEQVGAPFRFVPVHEDTRASPEEAVNVINRFIAQGIKVIVGPLSTSETAAVMPIVNREKVVVISPSSTGQAAAYPDDYVFRAPPPDTKQGPALAQIILSRPYHQAW